jgi:hypothetical protein
VPEHNNPEVEQKATSVQIRQKIADLAKKRSDLEQKLADAQRRRSAKESEAAARAASAGRATGRATQQSYLRQAEAAQKSALSEGAKIATLSKSLSSVASDEARQNRDLTSALKSEATAAARVAEKDRKERAARDRRQLEQRKADERRRQQDRMIDEQRRREDQAMRERTRLDDHAATTALVSDTEQRLARRIEAIRPP